MAIKVANNQSLTAITALPSAVSGGAMTLLETQTASSSATIDFTSDIDSTYDEYVFKFYDIHPETDGKHFMVNFTTDGTNFNVTKTTTTFRAQHNEADGSTDLSYQSGGATDITSSDLAQSTEDQLISVDQGSDNDQCCIGELYLFSPSSTTFVKHFLATSNGVLTVDYSNQRIIAGYLNTTSAITGVRFLFNSDNIDAGTIKLYGIK